NFLKDIPVFILGLLLCFPFAFIKLDTNIYVDAAIKLLICGMLFLSLIRLFFNTELKIIVNRFMKKKEIVL
ncbi:MAG TPA: hypothetical protein VMY77_06335, partial [Chitinophagaceae bacterium]|nr:hypothetical protein [Chitinophagaceae bacterium]